MAARGPVPIDALDVGRFRLVPAGCEIGERIEHPTFTEAAGDAMLLLVVVVAEDVDQESPGGSFPGRLGRKNEVPGLIAERRRFGNEDIDGAALPTFVLVERPPGFLQSHLHGVLVGALNEGANVFAGAYGAGDDGFLLARRRVIAAQEMRRRHHQDQEKPEAGQP